MDDQKLPSSIIMISFSPSQMSCSFGTGLAPCCPAAAAAARTTCTGEDAFDPQVLCRLSGSGCGRWWWRWYVEVGTQEGASAWAASSGKLTLRALDLTFRCKLLSTAPLRPSSFPG